MSDIQRFNFDANGDRIFETPVVHLTFDDGEVLCRYDNTTVKEFGDPQFNHIEWVNDEGRVMGLRAIPEALDELKAMGFPRHYEPNIIHDDPSSYEWFVSLMLKDVRVDEVRVPEWFNDGN